MNTFHVIIGLLLAATGRLNESRPPLETAIRLAPDDGDTFVVLGNVHLRTGDVEAAVEAFQSALKLDPGNPQQGDDHRAEHEGDEEGR